MSWVSARTELVSRRVIVTATLATGHARVTSQTNVLVRTQTTATQAEEGLLLGDPRLAFDQAAKRGGSGNLDRCAEWSFCLTAARMAAEQERR